MQKEEPQENPENAQVASDGFMPPTVVYKFRWLVLLGLFLLSFGNGITWITFSTISNITRDYYGVTLMWVNSLSLVFMITYIPLAFVGSWVLDRKGLEYGLFFGAGCTILGVWIRMASVGGTFAWALIGQIVCSIGQPFILSASPKLAANWFADEQRALATTIASVGNPLGVAIGFIIPTAVVSVPNDIPLLLLVEALIVTVCSYPTFILIWENPPTPASTSSSLEREESFSKSLKTIAKDVNMWILFIEFGFGLGAFNTLATLVNNLMEPYGYTNDQSSAVGACVVVLGLVGSGVAGVILDKTKRYKLVLLTCLALATGSMLLFTFMLKEDNMGMLIFTACILGFSTTPVIPVSFETSAEMTFPLGEATPTSFLLVSGQITGIGFVIWMQSLIDNGHIRQANLITVVCLAVSTLVTCFLRVKTKRLNYDQRTKLLNEAGENDSHDY
ncbi:hypothetical protein PROFUN_07404 [Planoprotostelium fungivorum]|uniref:Major facilitator superfamily (MFS) profile domain-containing protein n=1 Tax=Planoprotostelium fungivorum TaxID=1890364 RepID=A0A2P6MTH9_9EUKA|nr:hypothetical protein PROFUN_07404 [Planoprotostelium fungivorum]